MKNIIPHIQEAQRISSKINRGPHRHIIVKQVKEKNTERSTRKDNSLYIQGNHN